METIRSTPGILSRKRISLIRPFVVNCLMLIAFLGWTGWVAAAACTSTDYQLNTQAQVDALGAAGCDSILGYLSIQNTTDITNLDGLVKITSIKGDLFVNGNAALTNIDGLGNITSHEGSLFINYNTALTNLNGLVNLTRVGAFLYIEGNDVLTTLNGLRNITSVGRNLNIEGNDALTNLDGLVKITSIGGDLFVIGNAALTNIDGLGNITSHEGSLLISDNTALTNLNGLANLTSVGISLSIEDNDALTNLDGLVNISSVEDSLSIANNAALTNLSGLSNLLSVGGRLSVRSNDALNNVDDLANLTSVGGDLSIFSNTALSNLNGLANLNSLGGGLVLDENYQASCEGVAELLGWPDGPPDDTVAGGIDIGDNGTGCDSIAEILASVSGPTTPNITNAVAIGGGSILLEFSPSSTTDSFFPITGYEAACTGRSVDLSEAPAVALLNNTPVTRTLTVSGYDPVSVLSYIEVDMDIDHYIPTELNIILTTPQGTRIFLWRQDQADEGLVGTFPTTLPSYNSISSVGRQLMDGNWVLQVEDVQGVSYEGVLNAWGLRISENLKAEGSGSPITVNGATRGRDYSCTVAPITGLGTLPLSNAVTAKSDFPTAPTVTSTDYEDGTIRLTVSVADNGGADITEYSASCTDGISTFTGTSSTPTIEVTGLTNGTAYTCSASATNAVGSSGASASTDSITPALPTGLPIWLLYEATK